MLKRVQHDKKKFVIPNLFRNLDSGNVNKLIAFVLVIGHEIVKLPALPSGAPWRRRVDFVTFSNVDKKAKVIILPISSPNISVDLSI